MADELDLDLDSQETTEDIISRKDKRLKSLSDKVKETSEARDALAKEKEQIALAKAEAEKERDFFKGFSKVSSKYQNASEYQDKIWEKVKSGYDVEDATVSILHKEGKFTPAPPAQEKINAAGGSAATGIADTVEKTPDKMSQTERLAALREAESKGERLL